MNSPGWASRCRPRKAIAAQVPAAGAIRSCEFPAAAGPCNLRTVPATRRRPPVAPEPAATTCGLPPPVHKYTSHGRDALSPGRRSEPPIAQGGSSEDNESAWSFSRSRKAQTSARGPLMRTIPRAAPPGGEAMATIVSSRGYMHRRRYFRCFFTAACAVFFASALAWARVSTIGPPGAAGFGRKRRSSKLHKLEAMK